MSTVVLTVRRTLAAFLLGLAGCTVGRDHEPPAPPPLPPTFREAGGALAAEPAQLAAWWRQLGDPVLDRLVERAALGSLDLKAALARVDEARALRGVAKADWWPNVDARAAYQRRSDSENTPFGAFAVDFDRYTAGLDASRFI